MFSSYNLRLQSLQPHELLRCLEPAMDARRWLVAYSGGVDSHVLLHLMAQLTRLPSIVKPLPRLEAIHINHQLQANAESCALHCQQQAALLNIPLSVQRVDIHAQSGGGLEEKARQARLECLASLTGPDDLILMGHHLDDQIETLFLRLLRGSGSRGMAAIPQSRRLGKALLFRPLLDITRTCIEQYAAQHAIEWIEDPSNQSSDFDRNFLRLQLLPLVQQRWPQYRQTVARAAQLSEESSILNTELAEIDFHSLGLYPNSDSLPLSALAQLSVARKKNLLRYWLQSRGLVMPSAAQLHAVLDQVINAKIDAEPVVRWLCGKEPNRGSSVEIRRFRDELYAFAALPEMNISNQYEWDVQQPLLLDGAGQISAKWGRGEGVHSKLISSGLLTIRFRQGGERAKPCERSNSQTLKKLFQEYAVPTWLRDRVPLIYSDGILVAVADYWICEGFAAQENEVGLQITWTKP